MAQAKPYGSIIIVYIIKAYQFLISPMLGQRCRFYPCCSNYAIAAIENHGIIRGIFFAVKRLMKCHPWHPGGYDPISISKPKKQKL